MGIFDDKIIMATYDDALTYVDRRMQKITMKSLGNKAIDAADAKEALVHIMITIDVAIAMCAFIYGKSEIDVAEDINQITKIRHGERHER